MKLSVKLPALVIFSALAVVVSQASSVTLSGSAWINVPAASANAVLGSIPATPADVSFTVTTSTDIEFSSFFGSGNCGLACGNPTASYTLGSFLANAMPPATGIVENTPGALAGSLDSTIFLFTATVSITHDEAFFVVHDDGASFYVNGVAIPGIGPTPTGPVYTTLIYTGPTDPAASLQLVYGECCGPGAVFATNLPTGGSGVAPEPGTLAMFGTGVLGLSGIVRRKRRHLGR